MVANDHDGWVKLDGRALSILSASQRAVANLQGIHTQLPNATDRLIKMKVKETPLIVSPAALTTRLFFPKPICLLPLPVATPIFRGRIATNSLPYAPWQLALAR
jgi:hypothetical protein